MVSRIFERGAVIALSAISILVAASACGEDDSCTNCGGNGGPDAGARGATGGTGGAAGSGGSSGSGGSGATPAGGRPSFDTEPPPTPMFPQSVDCGGTLCEAPPSSLERGISACCAPGGGCGLETFLVMDQCFEPDQPGGLEAACPDYETPSGIAMAGCCGPDGCGALDRGGIGCIPLEALGEDAAACDYDPANDCQDLTEIVCDGAEDCGAGQVCCGEYDGTVYRNYGCYDSCPTEGTWREICHLDSECSNDSFQCLSSSVVPEWLARCGNSGEPPAASLSTAAGEINCGSQVCGAGEKCCQRDTKGPYCSPVDVDCACLPDLESDAGAIDGGGVPDGGGGLDASEDAAADAEPATDAAADSGGD